MRALGYDRDFEEVIAREPVAGAPRPRVKIVETPAWQAIRVDPDRRTIETPAGIELDLGATAKALCADRAAAAAHDATGAGVLVSLGGDIALAGPPPEDGWRVRVTDDHRAGVTAPGQWITLCTGGLATSSTEVRRWRTGNGEAHHLLNPATEQPAESPWRTVSVCAASCLDANIASTAAIVRGTGAPPWLESLRLPSRLVSREATVAHLAGWPPDGDDLPEAENQAPAAGAPR
jgi:thiamine biosynthesis lipoprotein